MSTCFCAKKDEKKKMDSIINVSCIYQNAACYGSTMMSEYID